MRTSGKDKTRILKVSGSTLQPTSNQLLSILAAEGARIMPPVRFAYDKTRSLSNEPPAPFSLDMLDKGEIDLALETFPLNSAPPVAFNLASYARKISSSWPALIIRSPKNEESVSKTWLDIIWSRWRFISTAPTS